MKTSFAMTAVRTGWPGFGLVGRRAWRSRRRSRNAETNGPQTGPPDRRQGKTQRAFVAECRGVPLAAGEPPASEPGKGQFATEAEAKEPVARRHRGWVNLRSKVYHVSGSKSYGATKAGAYMCEKESRRGRLPRGEGQPKPFSAARK